MPKEVVRKELKRERARVDKQDRRRWDQAIRQFLFALPATEQAEKIMIYLSFGWEIDTWAIVEELHKAGKQIYVPVVQSKPKALLATEYTARDDLVPAVFGILQPPPGTPIIDPQELDLVVVPGLVFSEAGYRIGYGGGYYDRFLTTTEAQRVGLVYTSFIRDLQPDPWDQPVDFLVTEAGSLRRK